MWGLLFNFLGGPLLNNLVKAYSAKLAAQNTTEAHAVELAVSEIQGEVAARQIEATIIRQEQGWWVTALPRPLLAFCVVIIVGKLLVYDIALGQWTGGHTDRIDEHIWWVINTIIVSYFGGRTIEKVARIFKR